MEEAEEETITLAAIFVYRIDLQLGDWCEQNRTANQTKVPFICFKCVTVRCVLKNAGSTLTGSTI